MKLKVTSFNCENLFGRYRLLDLPWDKRPSGYENRLQVFDVIALEPGRSGAIKPKEIAEVQRKTTANAILGAAPDILAVQEVENLPTLRMFNHIYCKNYFDRIVLADGNDARGIDVGLLLKKGLKAEIIATRLHFDEVIGGGYVPQTSRLSTQVTSKVIFARDCLEVDVKIKNTVYTFLVNHFKAQDGKPASTEKRIRQSTRVKELADNAFKEGKKPIVLGDLNIDVKQPDYDQSLDKLYKSTKLHDPFKNLPDEERWSHYYSSGRKVSRLDYVLVDKSLSVSGTEFFREGLTPHCKQYKGPRLKSMEGNDLEASDHCPTSVILDI